MKTQSFFEQNGGTYTQVGDVLIPDLVVEETAPIARWGRMRKHYLKEHHPAVYSNMLLNGTLFKHLTEIDQACEDRMDLIIRQMAEQEGVTETLKASAQMEWVRRMNGIRNRAEEIVLHELVYC